MENKAEWILHIDGDAFFASVEVSRRPDLFGQPVVVGEERGIATALTYAAKALGVKRGDPIFKIRREYPQVTILSSHFELYRKFAKNLGELLEGEVDNFEAYSIDECFATLTGSILEVQEKVKSIKNKLQKRLGITYSFGVSTTKTLAKIASKRNKPDGLCFLMNDQDISEALKTTSAESIWGVGYALNKKLKIYKIKTAYDFINSDLKKVLSSSYTGPVFLTKDELCGNKHFEVGATNAHKKSIQATRSFIKKTNSKKNIFGELSRNVEIACSELRSSGLVTKRFYFFVKSVDIKNKYIEKVVELPNYTNMDSCIMKYIKQSFDDSLFAGSGVYKKSGVVMLDLELQDELPQDLFGVQESVNLEEAKVTSVVDQLRNRFGFGIIGLASSLEVNNNRSSDYKRRHANDIYIEGLPYPFLGIIN